VLSTVVGEPLRALMVRAPVRPDKLEAMPDARKRARIFRMLRLGWLALCLLPWAAFAGEPSDSPADGTLFLLCLLLLTLPISIPTFFVMAAVPTPLTGTHGALEAALQLILQWTVFVAAAYWQWTWLVPRLWSVGQRAARLRPGRSTMMRR
jgi:hypothetical protein